MRKQNQVSRAAKRNGGPRLQRGDDRRRDSNLAIGPTHPPQLNGYQLKHALRMRFTASAAFSGAITWQNLLDTWLVATTTVAASQVFQAVKIRGIEIFAMGAIGVPTTVSVEFSGTGASLVGDQTIHVDTSMGIQPAHVRCKPNAKSLASMYQLSAANTAFTLNVPQGAVIDVDLTFKGQFALSTAAQNAVVAATAGAFYLRGLDGVAIGATALPPTVVGTASASI